MPLVVDVRIKMIYVRIKDIRARDVGESTLDSPLAGSPGAHGGSFLKLKYPGPSYICPNPDRKGSEPTNHALVLGEQYV